jgi:hypothetical protein
LFVHSCQCFPESDQNPITGTDIKQVEILWLLYDSLSIPLCRYV